MPRASKALIPAIEEDVQLVAIDPEVPEPPGPVLRGGYRVQNVRQVRELARTFTVRALNKLVRLMDSGRDERIQFQATVELLNRAWGHPPVDLQITETNAAGDPTTIARATALAAQQHDPEQLRGVLAALQDALGIKPVIPAGFEATNEPLATREDDSPDPQLVTQFDQLGEKYADALCANPCGHAKLEHENGAGSCDICRCPLYTRPCTLCAHPRLGHTEGFFEACRVAGCSCTGD